MFILLTFVAVWKTVSLSLGIGVLRLYFFFFVHATLWLLHGISVSLFLACSPFRWGATVTRNVAFVVASVGIFLCYSARLIYTFSLADITFSFAWNDEDVDGSDNHHDNEDDDDHDQHHDQREKKCEREKNSITRLCFLNRCINKQTNKTDKMEKIMHITIAFWTPFMNVWVCECVCALM